MSKDTGGSYITGSDLLTGEVVYLNSSGNWVPRLEGAQVIADPSDAVSKLRCAELQTDKVVGPVLVTAKSGSMGQRAIHIRERIRATGPSNYPHGKQEHQQNV